MKTPKRPEVLYRKELNKLVKALRDNILSDIVPLLKQFESEYVNDAYAATLERAFDNLRKRYAEVGTTAKAVASSFVTNSDQTNKKRFYAAMKDAVGVNLETIVQNEGLEDILIATTRENVGLIKSIPDEYLKKVETIVFTSTVQGNKASSMISQIRKLNKTTAKRAKRIARDQSSKLNSALSQQRQQNLGIGEYVWRTSGDERVRETHKANNGKVFKWNKPPKNTGHPGQDIQCRCVAQPIIKL